MKTYFKKAFLLVLVCLAAFILVGGCQGKETLSSTFFFTDDTPAEEFIGITEGSQPTESDEVSENTGTTLNETERIPADSFTPELYFSTTDRDGNPVTEEIFRENKLTMLNFWESWCGPCVREIPELEQLQKDFSDRGFRLIGITSYSSSEEDIDAILQYTGATYTMLRYCESFDRFQTGYVPTTVFVDQYGHIAGDVLVGSASYETWAMKIESLLND